MRKRCYVSFGVPREARDRYYRLLESIGCLDGWHEAHPDFPRSNPWFGYTFDVGDPCFQDLLRLLHSTKLDWSERHEHLYTNAELRRFPLLILRIVRKSIDGGGPEHNTEYDVSAACPRCGTGAVQTSPLMVPLSELPKGGSVCRTHRGHVLVASELAEALRHAAVSGIELRQARLYQNNEPLDWWQIISTYTMPRMSPKTMGIVRDTDPGWGCPVCGRDCYGETMDPPTEIIYDRCQADPAALPDVVQTWECFGRSMLHDDPQRHLIRGFAQPMILVKPKVLDILRERKVTSVCFSPVRIVE